MTGRHAAFIPFSTSAAACSIFSRANLTHTAPLYSSLAILKRKSNLTFRVKFLRNCEKLGLQKNAVRTKTLRLPRLVLGMSAQNLSKFHQSATAI